MPDYMQDFDDEFEYKNEPDETTPDDADNANISLKNTRLLKRLINDIITGNLDLVVRSIKSVNLFDSERWYNELHNVNSSSIEKEIVDEVQYYKFIPSSIYTYQFMKDEFKENMQYTLSFVGRQVEYTEGYTTGFQFSYTDGTFEQVLIPQKMEESKLVLTSASSKTIKYISLCWFNTYHVRVRDIMLVEGTESKEYSHHQF